MTFSDLPEICKPFVAAMLALDDDHRPEIVAQFHPELILLVHESFAAHLYALTLEGELGGEASRAVAAQHLAIVERADLLQPAWQAFAWLRAYGQGVRVLKAASMPPAAPLH